MLSASVFAFFLVSKIILTQTNRLISEGRPPPLRGTEKNATFANSTELHNREDIWYFSSRNISLYVLATIN